MGSSNIDFRQFAGYLSVCHKTVHLYTRLAQVYKAKIVRVVIDSQCMCISPQLSHIVSFLFIIQSVYLDITTNKCFSSLLIIDSQCICILPQLSLFSSLLITESVYLYITMIKSESLLCL